MIALKKAYKDRQYLYYLIELLDRQDLYHFKSIWLSPAYSIQNCMDKIPDNKIFDECVNLEFILFGKFEGPKFVEV